MESFHNYEFLRDEDNDIYYINEDCNKQYVKLFFESNFKLNIIMVNKEKLINERKKIIECIEKLVNDK
ncbi:hypothetical protein AHEV_243 [Adoxophyes honmai entomopoxvirus 'L']|uniref:Uncharacterized protein n=1 Tax=Adoxophyes honmai entomopoxvirus 'L' TaxID=1293540 RepID=A0A916KPC6_9POXV|nr:hypothetical protein AHEV_243 [Adoxophyes honmai entomopoxvirus 'L']CCU55564.1 hypothetical protein AHEV_243 [Adoxophyes honmai entomopoxvirus 'L']